MADFFEYLRFEQIDSTNAEALRMVTAGNIHKPACIVASEQTKGKGQGENVWESEKGKNLTISLIVEPTFLEPSQQFLINEITSLAVCDVIANRIKNQGYSIKWPNDVYIGLKKIAGILPKNIISGNRIEWSIIGIGFNINQLEFFSSAPNPASLASVSGMTFELEHCLEDLLQAFEGWWGKAKDGNTEEIRQHYLNLLFRRGERCTYLYHRVIIEATITGISPYGQLELVAADGRRLVCDNKQIEFVL